MSQSDRTMGNVVSVQAKISSLNLLPAEYTTGTTIPEGQPFTISASTGKAVTPTGGNTSTEVIFMNWVPSTRSDITFVQADPFDTSAPSVNIQAGGLTGIVGDGLILGLKAASWHSGTLPTVGQRVRVDSTSKKFVAETSVAARDYYGSVAFIKDGYAFFTFFSAPVRYHAA